MAPLEVGDLEAVLSPCYLNEQDAIQVAIGSGAQAAVWLREHVRKLPLIGELGNCFAPPQSEYEFPRDLYAYR